MQKKFTLKLIIFMALGMIIIMGAVFFMQHYISTQNNLLNGENVLDEAIDKLQSNQEAADDLRETLDESALAKTRAFAKMIELEPDIIKETEKMEEIAKVLDVDEVHVTDENGVLLWGNIPSYYGFDFAEGDQTKPFLDILDDDTLEIAQDPQENATTGTLFQYTGVARLDEKGIVQIGLSPEVLENALANNALPKVLSELAVDNNSYLFAIDAESGEILAHKNEALIGKDYKEAGFHDEVLQNEKGNTSGIIDNVKVIYLYTKNDNTILGLATSESAVYAQRNSQSLMFLIEILIVFIILIILINRILKVDIINGVYQIIKELKAITGGDLNVSASVRTNKEFIILSDSINNMVSSIQNGFAENEKRIEENEKIVGEQQILFENMKDISKNIKSLSQQTLSISNQISQGSQEQTDCIEDVMQTMEYLSKQADNNAQVSEKVSQNAYRSSERVETANASMSEMKKAMSEIAENSEKVKSIIGNIDDIAEQTNLLAINAAIEAARAGESGRGFAVVADQVGELATQSAVAASETTQLIQNALNAIEKGDSITEKTSEEFHDIIQDTKNVGEQIKELVSSFREQTDIVKKAVDGVTLVAEIAQKNSNVANESEEASRSLADQSEKLNDVINKD